jgi:hypothetical protein
MAYVYRHIRLDNNKPFYIGIGSDDEGKYKRAHNKSKRSILWKRILAKTEYKIDILLDDLSWEEACEKEKEFISMYGRLDNCLGTLCNHTDGGEGLLGNIQSKETINKRIANTNFANISAAVKKRNSTGFQKNIEIRKKISQTLSIVRKKVVGQFTLDDIFIKEWKSATDVSNILNIDRGSICKCCNNGIYKSVGGYKWKYLF